jgi:hypothetical protein
MSFKWLCGCEVSVHILSLTIHLQVPDAQVFVLAVWLSADTGSCDLLRIVLTLAVACVDLYTSFFCFAHC